MPFDRANSLQRLASERFDVLVVGGGITGAGVALDAAARGLKVGLVERDDFASGTSSKSSKLVHGGLRYLQQGDIRLVYEALAERQRLRRNAPHLVKIMPFLIPIFGGKEGIVPKSVARALGWAMWMYDLTGGARIGKLHKRLSKAEALAYMPTLPEQKLSWGYLYYDAQADDARLTLTVLRTAAGQLDAVIANRCALVAMRKDDAGRVVGATVSADGATFAIDAGCVVNATGVWADDVRALDEGTHPDSIRPAKGVHATVPWSLVQNTIAVVVPVPKDKRSVFVVPWGDRLADGTYEHTYIGTTDTDYDGDPNDPQCTPEDIEYLLRAINFSVSGSSRIEPSDITGTWAGLRPLVKSAESGRTADLSRGHKVALSDSGVVTITGGKLTTYRHMAADTVDAVGKLLGRRIGRSRTKKLPLLGADGYETVKASANGDPVLLHLADRYGDEARSVLAIVEADASLGEPLVAGLPYLKAEAVYAARYEMVTTIDDVLSRRTRARLLARDASAAAAPEVAALLAADLGWDDAEQARQVDAYRALIDHERSVPGLQLSPLANFVD
ncbi:MAG: glycerol-3-phosphate dehydrogenase [Acidimicrobiaceae bacterium]